MGERSCLTWSNFSSHVYNLFKNLHKNHEFTDVTLITDDQHQYKVHKFVLSVCSPVFSKILTSNPLSASIFLTGISHMELESTRFHNLQRQALTQFIKLYQYMT